MDRFRLLFLLILSFQFIASKSCNYHYRFNELNNYFLNKDEIRVIQYLNESKDIYIKTQAIYILGELKSQKAIPYLLAYLRSKYWELRYYSLISLNKIGWNFDFNHPDIKYLLEKEDNIEILNFIKSIEKQKDKQKDKKIN